MGIVTVWFTASITASPRRTSALVMLKAVMAVSLLRVVPIAVAASALASSQLAVTAKT